MYYKFNTLLISIFFEKTPLIKRDFKINNYICQKLFKENFCKINSFHRKTEQIMKKTLIFMIVLFPIWVFSQNSIQWSENFSDGEFSNNPAWSGTTGNFIVNPDMQLQSNALTTSRSYLSTPSEAFDDATWEFWVRMNYNPSSSNYALVHIISDKADLSGELNGYYVQIGNTADEISLYRKQVGSNPLKLIDGADGTVNSNPVIVKVKVTRSKDGTFALYRQRLSDVQGFSDTDFVQEGASVNDTIVKGSRYFGVSFVNSSTTGKLYFFDDISVKIPHWLNDALCACILFVDLEKLSKFQQFHFQQNTQMKRKEEDWRSIRGSPGQLTTKRLNRFAHPYDYRLLLRAGNPFV